MMTMRDDDHDNRDHNDINYDDDNKYDDDDDSYDITNTLSSNLKP